MEAGKLNCRITLQQPVATRDTTGGEAIIWADFATLWASKAHKTSKEFYNSQKINAEITDLFIIRYRAGIDTKMRLVYGGKNYDIIGADDPDNRRIELWIMAKAVE